MSALEWGIKASLLGYVRAMADGEVIVADGAHVLENGSFSFPEISPLRFGGSVTLIGHGGMMRVVIRDPAIDQVGDEIALSIADPDDETVRLAFATVAALEEGDDGSILVIGTALTADGADLFFGPYVTGTPLDDATVRRTEQ